MAPPRSPHRAGLQLWDRLQPLRTSMAALPRLRSYMTLSFMVCAISSFVLGKSRLKALSRLMMCIKLKRRYICLNNPVDPADFLEQNSNLHTVATKNLVLHQDQSLMLMSAQFESVQ